MHPNQECSHLRRMDCRQPASASIVCCKAGMTRSCYIRATGCPVGNGQLCAVCCWRCGAVILTVNDHDTKRTRLQEAQANHLQKELSDGLLCAVINNNTRCYNESTEFADHLDDALAGPYKVPSSIVISLLASILSLTCIIKIWPRLLVQIIYKPRIFHYCNAVRSGAVRIFLPRVLPSLTGKAIWARIEVTGAS